MSDFLRLHGVYSPWNSIGQNTGVGNLSLLQGNQTQVSTLQADSLPAEPLGKPQWGASLIAQLVKNLPAMQETRFDSWVRKIRWRRDRLPTPVFLGFPGGSAGKESACHVGDLGLIPGLGRSPGEGKAYPLQYSGLENSMDCIVHGLYSPWGFKELDEWGALTNAVKRAWSLKSSGYITCWTVALPLLVVS